MSSIYDYISSTIFNGVFVALENIPFMDSKNISKLVVSEYIENECTCSLSFLKMYLTIIQSIFDQKIYLNKNLNSIYFEYPDLEDNIETLVDMLMDYDSKYIMNLIEQYLIIQLYLFIEYIQELSISISIKDNKVMKLWYNFYSSFLNKYINNIALFKGNNLNIQNWTDFFNVKIKQPILLINPVFLNTDSRSVRSKSFLYKKNDEYIYSFDLNKPITTKFDIYCPDGFTILEFLVHILTIRGNPLDRWYTMFSDCVDRKYYNYSSRFGYKGVLEFEEKYNKMIKNDKIKNNFETIYISFDHGS